MQFHLNGFQPGDPEIHAPVESRVDANAQEVDVLIVGSGPAGLTLAAQLAAFPQIRTRIVEQKPGPMELGQADGIACRTMEMFEAFGFAEKIAKEAYWVNETTFWKPDPERRVHIHRSGRIQDTEDGLSEFPHVILNQARVHDRYLETMRNAPRRLEPVYNRRVAEIRRDDARDADYPVTVVLDCLEEGGDGRQEIVKARYVVGCDGARSKVREALGRSLRGDSANQAWGVMDVLAVTDFPDIRMKAAIHSANEGNMLIIPREGGYLVRLYIELDKLREDERVASRNITPDHLVAAANRILQPYTIDVKEIAWWSVYEIGQRLTDKFDDVPEGEEGTRAPRIFIAGDACHTHSPKAGQGMNVSMQDSFNLGWKLAAVLQGQCTSGLLHSYSGERRAIAKELIDFDREFAKMFSAAPKEEGDSEGDGVDPKEFQRYFVKQGRFTAGTETRYGPSLITGAADHENLANGFPVGMRFHSAPVIRLADAKPMQLGHVVKADGRWRIFAFAGAGDPACESSGLLGLLEFLFRSENSPVVRYTPEGEDIDSVIDLRAVFQQDFRTMELSELPPYLLPSKGRYGLRDYEKVFCADLKNDCDVFDMRGIDRQRGCMVVVRPDQYVAQVLPLDGTAALAALFDGFMLRR
ncbi:FAD-binding monooxygenase [Nisaea acidiphila]|uniref:FAD-binding monooxygenase n=1 Tax=Nisaea acidiphila TaxID=1862145 RepID=A0A9J7B0H8_9PROT|nr:FAD-binding monooxygenase [Nisaea acidiphila]UUX51189.1 FAD-binding monooxygenase [Nisaea acidiphila]